MEEIFLVYNVFLICMYVLSRRVEKSFDKIDSYSASKRVYGNKIKNNFIKELAAIGHEILALYNKIIKPFINNPQTLRVYKKRTIQNNISELFGEEKLKQKVDFFYSLAITWILFNIDFVLLIGVLSKTIDNLYVIFSVTLCVISAFLPLKALNNMVIKKRKGIKRDFPDFLNRLLLLINAGMSVEAAWNKAAESLTESHLYLEIQNIMYSMKCGKTLSQAFEDFAKRCRVPEITRLMSVLVQNLRKGNSEITSILRIHSNECWEMRKKEAQKLGEEASAKMIVPLMLMLIAVLILTMTPALFALYGY